MLSLISSHLLLGSSCKYYVIWWFSFWIS